MDVILKITWKELFEGYSHEDRRARWEEWKDLCIAHDGDTDKVDEFKAVEQCALCQHCDEDWCLQQWVPCIFNPILIQAGCYGMACGGAGFEQKQLTLF